MSDDDGPSPLVVLLQIAAFAAVIGVVIWLALNGTAPTSSP